MSQNEEEGSILESNQGIPLRFEVDRKETRSRFVFNNSEDIRWTDCVFLNSMQFYHPYNISLRGYDEMVSRNERDHLLWVSPAHSRYILLSKCSDYAKGNSSIVHTDRKGCTNHLIGCTILGDLIGSGSHGMVAIE